MSVLKRGRTRQRRRRLMALLVAQKCRCAACGHLMDPRLAGTGRPDSPTLDHVETVSSQRQRGGQINSGLSNLLAKHLRCNQRRGNGRPTQIDRQWQAKVAKVLATAPETLEQREAMARAIFDAHAEGIAA